MALVSQQAWIFNGTLRDNILFHKPYDAARYKKILKACALEQDIKILPDGDLITTRLTPGKFVPDLKNLIGAT